MFLMSVFRFKQFIVDQQGCAMKINTDGVLLGAMVMGAEPTSVLDIGTGTGVIALMMAQRYNGAKVFGVELDAGSAAQATLNVAQSPFAHRIEIAHRAFQEFTPSHPVDLMVSNPPFFTNSLRNPDNRKGQARHTDRQFFTDLLVYAQKYLSDKGAMELILPTSLAYEVTNMALHYDLHLTRRIHISSFTASEIIRQIIRLERNKPLVVGEHPFVIYKEKGYYSNQYKEVLKPFFLAF